MTSNLKVRRTTDQELPLADTVVQLLTEALVTMARNGQLGDTAASEWSRRCREAIASLTGTTEKA